MAVSVQTFGVDVERILTEIPSALITSDGAEGSLLDNTRAGTLITASGSRICGILEASFGAGSSAAIAALGSSDLQYLNCQRYVALNAVPAFLRALSWPPAVEAQISGLILYVQTQLDFFLAHPGTAIGRVSDTSRTDSFVSSVVELGLDTTSTTKQRERREFDGRSALLGVDENGFRW